MILTRPPLSPTFLLPPSLILRHRPWAISAANSDDQPLSSADSDTTPTTTTATKQQKRKLKVKSRRRRGNEDEERVLEMASNSSSSGRVAAEPKKKRWEDMTLAEKALEMYLGEKGALFWLNKFAYASIFIVIGGWILFRFVGPSLGLYQLDSPLLAPSDLFTGK